MVKTRQKTVILNIILAVTTFLMFFLWINSTNSVYAKDIDTVKYRSKDVINIATNGLRISYSYGLNRYVKYGRYTNFTIEVSSEEEFHGLLEVMIPNQDENTLYRKEISIENGKHTKKIEVSLPVNDDTGLLHFKIKNAKGKVVINEEESIQIGNYYRETYIGILSDNFDDMLYLDKPGSKLFQLEDSDITTIENGLDLFDVIIINNFDTNKLSKEQIDALERWVISGGSLVIGTGENVDKTLNNLENLHITTNIGHKGIYLNFGISKSLLEEYKAKIYSYVESRKTIENDITYRNQMLEDKNISPITLDGIDITEIKTNILQKLRLEGINKVLAEVELKDGKRITNGSISHPGYIRTMGNGNIQLYQIDLGMTEDKVGIELAILYSIVDNLSEAKSEQLMNEYYSYNSDYDLIQGLNYSDTNNFPKVWEYMVIIIIYLILIGPIAYILLKKLDKRAYTWVLIPLISITFTGLIYVLGKRTRIDEPFTGYIHLKYYMEDNTVSDELYFSVTTASNSELELGFDGKYSIKEFRNYSINYYKENLELKRLANNDNYENIVEESNENSSIWISNRKAFSTSYYQVKNQYKEVPQVTGNIHYKDTILSGSIQNNYEYDINNAIFISDGYLFHINDLKSGEEVKLEELSSVYLNVAEEIYSSDFIYDELGIPEGEEKLTGESARKYAVLKYLIETAVYSESKSYLIGFVTNNSEIELINELADKIDTYGVNGIVISVDVEYKEDGITFVPSIDNYVVTEEDDIFKYYQSRYLIGDKMEVKYSLPKAHSILEFGYLESRNEETDSENIACFKGDIYFKNQTTKEYDKVFEDGLGSKVTNVSDYMNRKNEIEIRYQPEITIQGKAIVLPDISYKAKEDMDASYK